MRRLLSLEPSVFNIAAGLLAPLFFFSRLSPSSISLSIEVLGSGLVNFGSRFGGAGRDWASFFGWATTGAIAGTALISKLGAGPG